MKSYLLLLSLAGVLFFSSCSKKIGPTFVQVTDSIRHYYPLVLGDNLELSYELKNVGATPLVISDMQPSCGCIVEGSTNERLILPQKSLLLHFRFYSGKNIGFVHHTIRLFANVKPGGMIPLVFDVNVVPPSDNTPDYEEVFKAKVDNDNNLSISMHQKVDGTTAQKGYYTDTPAKDSRHQEQFFWRK